MKKLYINIFLFLFTVSAVKSEIPVIVISAGKAIQSKSTVGSDVTVIDQTKIL